MERFAAAPWPKFLKVTSILGAVLLLAAGYAAVRVIPHGSHVPYAETVGTLVALAAPAVGMFAALFVVVGYELGERELRVARLLWATRVPLDGLSRAYFSPEAMRRSIRVFGNGGLFAITGVYSNRVLGRYRAFVTDPHRAVVLSLPRRVVVISPAEPSRFLETVRNLFPGVAEAPPHGPVGV
jgi:hypothetical protein